MSATHHDPLPPGERAEEELTGDALVASLRAALWAKPTFPAEDCLLVTGPYRGTGETALRYELVLYLAPRQSGRLLLPMTTSAVLAVCRTRHTAIARAKRERRRPGRRWDALPIYTRFPGQPADRVEEAVCA